MSITDKINMDTILPDEIVRLIYSFVRPSWLRLCNKHYAERAQTPRRRSLISWMRLKQAHERACSRIRDLKTTRTELQNSTYRNFRQKDAIDLQVGDIDTEITDLQSQINRIHRSIQLIDNNVSYPPSYLHARWKHMW